MAEHETRQYSYKKRIRQPPSVPFLWEVRPGVAHKGWKPENSSAVIPFLPPPSPIKLIASVPFNWEEEPGKPLPSFSLPEAETSQPLIFSLPPLCPHNDDESYSSSEETPSSPTSDSDSSSTSSYATGRSSLVGASFLEQLFPLLPPKTSFLEKTEYAPKGAQALKWADEASIMTTAVTRRPLTLGELIMMSRRRSYQRKAVQIRKRDTSMDFLKKRASGCCFFTSSINLVEKLEWKKLQPRLKLL